MCSSVFRSVCCQLSGVLSANESVFCFVSSILVFCNRFCLEDLLDMSVFESKSIGCALIGLSVRLLNTGCSVFRRGCHRQFSEINWIQRLLAIVGFGSKATVFRSVCSRQSGVLFANDSELFYVIDSWFLLSVLLGAFVVYIGC